MNYWAVNFSILILQAIKDHSKAIELNPNACSSHNCLLSSAYGELELMRQRYADKQKVSDLRLPDIPYFEIINEVPHMTNGCCVPHVLTTPPSLKEQFNRALNEAVDHLDKAQKEVRSYTKSMATNEQLVNDYTKAIERNPKDAKAYHDRGWVYYTQGSISFHHLTFTHVICGGRILPFNPHVNNMYELVENIYTTLNRDITRLKELCAQVEQQTVIAQNELEQQEPVRQKGKMTIRHLKESVKEPEQTPDEIRRAQAYAHYAAAERERKSEFRKELGILISGIIIMIFTFFLLNFETF